MNIKINKNHKVAKELNSIYQVQKLFETRNNVENMGPNDLRYYVE